MTKTSVWKCIGKKVKGLLTSSEKFNKKGAKTGTKKNPYLCPPHEIVLAAPMAEVACWC